MGLRPSTNVLLFADRASEKAIERECMRVRQSVRESMRIQSMRKRVQGGEDS